MGEEIVPRGQGMYLLPELLLTIIIIKEKEKGKIG